MVSDRVKAAIVLGASIIASVWLWAYLSPFQTCIRTLKSSVTSQQEQNVLPTWAELTCLGRFDNEH